MKKALLLIGIIYLGFSACKEDSLIADNPAPPGDNLELNFLPYYGEDPLKTDSIYTNAVGSRFMLDTISMLIGDITFHDLNLNETLDSAKNYVLLSNVRPQAMTGRLEAMGYYGNFRIALGTDSAGAVDDRDEILAIDPNLVRNDLYGVDFFNIKGRIFDPASPPEDSVMIPVEYTLGSYLLSDTAISEVRGFSVDNLQNMKIFLLADLKPLLNFLPMDQVGEIVSDPTNTQDFTIAQAMVDSLNIGIF